MGGNFEVNKMLMLYGEFLRTSTNFFPSLYKNLGQKNRNQTIEIVVDIIISDLETYTKIMKFRGKAIENLNQEDIDKIRINLIKIIRG